ncbi:MAG: PTS transporter subunit EIIC, partial [Erysipelotrichaceae bacterium]
MSKQVKDKIMSGLKRISNHPYLKAYQKALMALIGVSFIAGLLVVLMHPITGINQAFFDSWTLFVDKNTVLLNSLLDFSIGLIALYLLIGLVLNLTKVYHIEPFHPLMAAIASFIVNALLLVDTNLHYSIRYLGIEGIPTALIIGILSVEIFRLTSKLSHKAYVKLKHKPIHLLDTAIAYLLILGFALALRLYFSGIDTVLPAWILGGLLPLFKASDSIWTLLIIFTLARALWFFGIDGTRLLMSVLLPIIVVNNAENLMAFQNDMAIPHILSTSFLLFEMGALPLILAMLIAKSKDLKGKASLHLLPALFNYNEGAFLSLPVVLNWSLFIPLVLSSTLSIGISYMAITMHWIAVPLFTFGPYIPSAIG